MIKTKLPFAYVLSFVLLALLFIQSLCSLVIPGLYRDNDWVVASIKAGDLVTLIVIVPLLGLSLFYSIRGSERAQLIWLGTVYYVFYASMFSVFGTNYNKFLLLFLSIFIISMFTLINGLLLINYKKFEVYFQTKSNIKVAGFFLVVCAAGLLIMWLSQFFVFVLTNQIPPIFLEKGGFAQLMAKVNIVFAVVPASLGAYWLFTKRPIGYVLSAMVLINCSLLCVLLFFIAISQTLSHITGGWDLMPIWISYLVICLWCLKILLMNIQEKKEL
jgi:hypothetical protein